MKWAFFSILLVFFLALITGSLWSNNNEILGTTPTKTSQTEALNDAKLYLKNLPFSYEGLIDQLTFENYSLKAAKYAADNCGANWFEQAVRAAQNYLSAGSLSKTELIEKLTLDKFTLEQAQFAAEATDGN